MSDIKYYKTSSPTVLAEFEKSRIQREELHTEGLEFAKKFGGEAVIARDINSSFVYDGLVFSPPKDHLLWTIPNDEFKGAQRPRRSLRNATAEDKLALKSLMQDWYKSLPKTKVEYGDFYESIGTDWGNILFAGIGWFYKDGLIYVTTSLPLNEHMVEITVTEYRAAEASLHSEVTS